jgi:hypothetical protein
MKCGNIVIIDIAILKATLPGGWTKLFDIPSGTISSTAATGLTVLLSSLFDIPSGYKEPEPTPLFQSDNSIFINGSQNTASNNYNKISVDVSSSDIPEDCKKLIEELLYELKNPYITPEKRSSKIKNFISDITSGTISSTAATGLTVLLSSLFSHIGM